MVRRRSSRRKKRSAYPGLSTAPAKRSGAWVLLVLGVLVLVNPYVCGWEKKTVVPATKQKPETASPAASIPATPLDSGSAQPAAPTPVGPPGAVEGKVGKSDTLGRLLKKSGLSVAESDEIIRSLSGVLDFRTIRAGQSFRIERGPDGRVKRFELELSKIQKVRAE